MSKEIEQPNTESYEDMSDEEAIKRIALAMKDNAPTQEDKQNIHTFLLNVVQAQGINEIVKVGNLRDDKDFNELGHPKWTVRGALEMSRISDKLMDNTFFQEYFDKQATNTTITSLSREGFLIRQATTTTKQVADATKRRKINKGMFGKKTIEEQGGSIN